MKCPFCGSEDTKVIDKRTSENGTNRRRRECLECNKRFTTYERIEGSGDIKKIKKRNGKIVDFDPEKITNAIFAAAQSVGGKDRKKADELTEKVIEYTKKTIKEDEIPTVEQIQDIVEKVLIEEGHAKTAKAYILYRQKRIDAREQKAFLSKVTDVVDGYVNQADWRVRENSNSGYAVSGLQAHISGAVIAEYALEKTYPIEIAKAHREADFHIHDLGLGVFGGYSFYRNEVVVVRNKKTKHQLILSLEQLYDLIYIRAELENGFEIKYGNEYEILDENGWTDVVRVLRHKTTKPLISLNTFNGNNLLVTSDHPVITLEDEKKIIACPECKSDNVIKNRTNMIGKDYFKCKSCNHKFGLIKEKLPDIKKRKEIYAEDVKLNNFAISPYFELDFSNNKPITAQDGWFIGMFIAEGYFKDKRLAFEMSDSPELRKLVNYLTINNISFNLNYSTFSGLQLLQKQNRITINLSGLSSGVQELIMQIRPYSYNKNLPITMLNLSPEIVGAMVSGVIDGDGAVRNDDKWVSRVNLRMTSKTLLSQMQFWLKSNDINSSLLTIDSYGERKHDDLIIRSKRQLYSLTTYMPNNKKYLFKECLKIDDKFKFSHTTPKLKSFSHFRKIEAIENDDEYVYDLTTSTHTFICNGILAHNCAGWSLRQLLQEGFNGVPGKVAAKPAKHFDAAIGQITNFFGTLQNEWAGAQAFSSFDTYLAPLIKINKLSYDDVKQGVQEFVFGINQTSRWGNQVPFTNITMDWAVPDDLIEEDVLYGGEKMQGVKYKDCQKEMDMINRAFIEVMMEGDMDGRIFTFPIPTYNITKDFDWDSENAKLLFEMTAKYGIPYFQNFINSSLNPGDVRSMCCRLQLNVKELKNKTGGLFGAGEQTGSIGVVTINLPRIGYLYKTKEKFFERLERLMILAKNSLEIKRKEVTRYMDAGLLPYTKRYLGHLRNHFSTIGLCGMNECCLNFLGRGYDITTEKGKRFALEILDFMREKLKEFQKETGHIYNLEATPAEGTSYRLAKHDKKRYPNIITAGDDVPYYTNSSQLPVDYTNDIFEALDMQDELQCKYTGGTVLHGFVGERISDWKACGKLVKRVAYNYKLPYFTITPTFSICPAHGYLAGEHNICPHTHTKEQIKKYSYDREKIECEVFSRVVGYFRPVSNWNDGKKAEFNDRVVFDEGISMKHEMKNKILESVKRQEILVEVK